MYMLSMIKQIKPKYLSSVKPGYNAYLNQAYIRTNITKNRQRHSTANMHLFKKTIETLEKGVRYVQS